MDPDQVNYYRTIIAQRNGADISDIGKLLNKTVIMIFRTNFRHAQSRWSQRFYTWRNADLLYWCLGFGYWWCHGFTTWSQYSRFGYVLKLNGEKIVQWNFLCQALANQASGSNLTIEPLYLKVVLEVGNIQKFQYCLWISKCAGVGAQRRAEFILGKLVNLFQCFFIYES